MYKIEKIAVPTLPTKRGITNTIPFEKLLESGDSVLIPHADIPIAAVKMATSRYARTMGVDLFTRQEGSATRVYRR